MNYSKSYSSAFNIIKKRKIKILLKEIKNQECFECSRIYPDYISLNNGIFICKDCVKNHLNLPKNISYIIKNDLNNLTLKNIQYLSYGGNRKLMEYINIEYPNLKKLSPIYFYKTYAMDYYRKYLQYLIEGGVKPIKPNIDIAYELMEQKSEYNNKKENKNNTNNDNYKKIQKLSTIKSDSFIKINKNCLFYPKIKPIVGTRNEFKLSQSLNKNNLNLGYNNQDLTLSSSIFNNFNYLNNSLKEEFVINGKLKPSSSDYKYKYDSPYKNNYDMDGNDEDINEVKDIEKDMNVQINDISGMNEFNERSLNINNINNNLKLKNKIIKRNKEDTNIKVFKIKNKINNNRNNNNNIYTKPVYQNYLYTFQNSLNNKNNDKNCLKNKHFFIDKNSNIYNIKKTRVGKNIINSIEDLRKYLNNNKYKQKEKYIFNLKRRSNNKSLQIDNSNILCLQNQNQNHKEDLTNINNSIIINKNLNVYYNDDDSLQTIFKKKAIGNAFKLNEKNQKINKFNYSLEKVKTQSPNKKPKIMEKPFKIKRTAKEWKKKLCNKVKEKKDENTFIKVNKMNSQLKVNKTINNSNNISSGNIFLNIYKKNNNKNNKSKKYIINNTYEEKTKIIQRISRLLKTQKEKDERMKSFEKIRVNQKESGIKKISRNLNDSKFNYIGVTTIKQKKEKEEKEKMKSNTEKKTRIAKSYNNIFDRKKRSLLLMKELINLPFGKKRTILEIVKTNNILSKSVSPTSKRLFQNYTEPNTIISSIKKK